MNGLKNGNKSVNEKNRSKSEKLKPLKKANQIASYLGLDASLTVVPFTEQNSTGKFGSFNIDEPINQFVLAKK